MAEGPNTEALLSTKEIPTILEDEYKVSLDKVVEVAPGWYLFNFEDQGKNVKKVMLGMHGESNKEGVFELFVRRFKTSLAETEMHRLREEFSALQGSDKEEEESPFNDIAALSRDSREMDLIVAGRPSLRDAINTALPIITSPLLSYFPRQPGNAGIIHLDLARPIE